MHASFELFKRLFHIYFIHGICVTMSILPRASEKPCLLHTSEWLCYKMRWKFYRTWSNDLAAVNGIRNKRQFFSMVYIFINPQRRFLPDYSDLTTLLYILCACWESKREIKIMKSRGWNKGQLCIYHRTPLVNVIFNTCQNIRCEKYHNPLPFY